jgi:tetratricopeptide (TPR) repeat protein
MTKLNATLLGVVMTVFTVSVYAQNAGDFNVVLTQDGKGVIVTDYTGSVADVTIPAEIEGLPVREIRALKSKVIRSLVIPDTVTTIGERAFCLLEGRTIYIGSVPTTSLVSVVIPDSVAKIGKEAFMGSTKLTSIVLPDAITDIPEGLFKGCTELTSVILPSNITSIGNEAFYNCSSLKSVNLSAPIAKIGNSAFAGCSSLASIDIPSTITSIGNNAFAASGLTSITLPASVTKIPAEAFYNCGSLTSVTFSDKIQEIGKDAFAKCAQIASVTIPDNILAIDASGRTPFASSQKLNLATQARFRNMEWSLWVNYNAGIQEFRNKNFDQAISYFDKQLQRTPNHANTYSRRGAAYQMKRDITKANADFEKSLQIEPSNANIYLWRGNAYENTGDTAKAMNDYEKALQLAPRNEDAKNLIAALKRKEDAEARKRQEAERKRQEEKSKQVVSQLEPGLLELLKLVEEIKDKKRLNAKQYRTFEDICRKFVDIEKQYIAGGSPHAIVTVKANINDPWPDYQPFDSLLGGIKREINLTYREKLSNGQKKDFDKAFPNFKF